MCFVKACPGSLFKHEFEVLKHKFGLTSLDGHVIQRFYRLQEYSSGLEPEEKPLVDAYHHEVGQCYQTLNHSCFTQETPFNMICSWQMDFYATSDRTFSFLVILLFSRFFFIHHVDLKIKEVDLDIDVASGSMVVQVYDPPPSHSYVQLLEKELIKT